MHLYCSLEEEIQSSGEKGYSSLEEEIQSPVVGDPVI